MLRGCGRRTRSPRARGRGEDQRATQRGEARRQAGRVALRPPCAPLYGAPSSTEQTSRRGPDSARSEGCGRPPSRRACGTGRSVAEACSKEPRPGAVESWSRARRRQPARAHAGCREPPSLAAHDADEWTGREPTRSRPTAWCRAALEPRRSARTPSGRRPSQPPARGLNRTGSGPLARPRTARAAGCGGGRSAGLGESARHAECGRCRPSIRLQVAGLQAGSVFILTAYQNVGCKTRVACTRSHPRRRP